VAPSAGTNHIRAASAVKALTIRPGRVILSLAAAKSLAQRLDIVMGQAQKGALPLPRQLRHPLKLR
jgi:hypothetical protein